MKNTIFVTATYQFEISREVELPEGRTIFDVKDVSLDHAYGQIDGEDSNGEITFWDESTQSFIFDGSDFNFDGVPDSLNDAPQKIEFGVPLDVRFKEEK